MSSPIRYADSGGLQIAYQVVGSGPLDVVFAFDWAANLELVWENPQTERFLRRFSNYARLILFDMRGVGLSDPVEDLPPIEAWMEDVRSVMKAVGSERAALVGHGHAGQLCMLVAAIHPEQTQALVTINSYARLARASDYPWGLPPGAQEAALKAIEAAWGTGVVMYSSLAPSSPDLAYAMGWLARLERVTGSPRRAALKQRLIFDVDVRDVLLTITVPTLVVQSKGNRWIRPGHGKYLADHIPGARYLECPGEGHWPWVSGEAEAFMDEVEEFLTGARRSAELDRVLTTVAITDIVGSTEIASGVGDRRWRDLLEVHESVARREIEVARGRLVKLTGDGLVATFDGPARAVRCVESIAQLLGAVGLRIRAGLHTGEVELLGDDIGGIAVHIAARLAGLSRPGEVLVSSAVKDLVVGSGISFEDRGGHALKGVPDEWRVFAAA
jgi:class 3 adenylate cyclase/pimeloyl-ACP methyl ester carboxylesterase